MATPITPKARGLPPILVKALREEWRFNLIESRRVVDDFCDRGVLQSYFGPGPYDEWLTAELETARRENRGMQATALAKKLNRANCTRLTEKNEIISLGYVQHARGLADAVYIVDDYFARYSLPGVLGPYPFGGVIIVTAFEVIFSLPIFAAIHFALSYFLSGRPISVIAFAGFYFLFVLEHTWRNWRKLRSPKRWAKYDAARDRLPSIP